MRLRVIHMCIVYPQTHIIAKKKTDIVYIMAVGILQATSSVWLGLKKKCREDNAPLCSDMFWFAMPRIGHC